jgi:hypothetical protein
MQLGEQAKKRNLKPEEYSQRFDVPHKTSNRATYPSYWDTQQIISTKSS